MEILMLKSKGYFGCDNCDRCCINRGDIKLTPINVIQISKYLSISIEDFLKKYTYEPKEQAPEIAIKSIGERKDCIFYNKEEKKCKIHKVEPMQCLTYPLIPQNLKKDYFYYRDNCKCKNKKLMKVKKWLNGKQGIYIKYKDLYIEWIALMEIVQQKWKKISLKNRKEIKRILFLNYDLKKRNIKKQIRCNMKKVYELIT